MKTLRCFKILKKLFVWFSINKLSLNLGKTNDMLFRSRPPDLELHLNINNAEIPKVTATKFLGIIIDDRLNGKPQIQSVKSKLSRIMSVTYKASKLITTAGMYTLYCSLFQPYISYGNEIWGNNYVSNVKYLCVVQRKAVRLICNADRLAQTNELYKGTEHSEISRICSKQDCHSNVSSIPRNFAYSLAKQIYFIFYYS